MKKVLCSLLLLAGFTAIQGQALKKYAIAGTGCSVNSYCKPEFKITYSEDSAKVYTSECGTDDIYYMVICIEMKKTIPDIADAQSVLKDYVRFLKVQFKITSSSNFSDYHILNQNKNTLGITEYWKDDEQLNWKVKGWTNSRFLTVLLAYSKKELPEATVNPFLDGLLFKGM